MPHAKKITKPLTYRTFDANGNLQTSVEIVDPTIDVELGLATDEVMVGVAGRHPRVTALVERRHVVVAGERWQMSPLPREPAHR